MCFTTMASRFELSHEAWMPSRELKVGSIRHDMADTGPWCRIRSGNQSLYEETLRT